MILSDSEILRAMAAGAIVIEPFDPACLGGNSYDVHLGPVLRQPNTVPLDAAREAKWHDVEIPEIGMVLEPDKFWLGSTVEYTESNVVDDEKPPVRGVIDGTSAKQWRLVPYLDGKSSVGRLGINIHATAGRGDVGFRNHWTLELTVAVPVRVYAGMPIGQLTWHCVAGEVKAVYSERQNSAYGVLPRDPNPQPSRMHLQPWALRARELARLENERDKRCTCPLDFVEAAAGIGAEPLVQRHKSTCPLAQTSLSWTEP